TTPREAAPAPRAASVRTPPPAEKSRPTESSALNTQRPAARSLESERHNPTFGIDYWVLGLGASLPAFLCAVVLLASAGFLPRVPQLPLGLALGGVLVLLSVGAVFAHANDYPAWTQPGVTLLPILVLFLPAATLRGEVVTRINGDPDRAVIAPLLATLLLLAAATLVCAIVAIVIGRHAPSFSGLSLLPAPLMLSWLILLAPPFEESEVINALGCSLALAALTTFIGWFAPAAWRPAAPALAYVLQFALFVALGIGWPTLSGALRPVIVLDLALLVGLIFLVLFIPLCAAWMRRHGWRAVERLMG
ncbi:MAG: hypothetical protein U0232_31245, partial [Thermomicrobiales bacterium]